MTRWALQIFLVMVALLGSASFGFSSDLPNCKSTSYFHNCFSIWRDGNGYVYVGEWKNNKQHGQGTSTFPDGTEYSGMFKDNKRHGIGTFSMPNGFKYIGEWRDNFPHGEGIEIDDKGKEREGIWENAQLKKSKTTLYSSEVPILHALFNKLSKEKRKTIQFNLADRNYYKSAIDGLYGKSTVAALKTYNKEYLGNPDLGKLSNVTALLDDLLKVKSTETEVVAYNDNVLEETKLAEPVPTPPLNFTQIKASYDAGDYSRAFSDAQVLAVTGNVEAQLLLGNMFADGKGTIQINTAAHMWFNIATMNGHDEAYEKRKAIAALMTPSAVEEAQKMAMICIQSNFKDCGLLLQTSQSDDNDQNTFFEQGLLKDNYAQQTLLKRKQLQYALRELGFYASSIDGIWGAKTEAAFTNYQRSNVVKADEPVDLFEAVLSEVTVPNAFANSARSNTTIDNVSSGSTDRLADSIDRMTKELEYQDGMRQLDNAQRILNSMMPRSYPIINCNTFGNLTTCY